MGRALALAVGLFAAAAIAVPVRAQVSAPPARISGQGQAAVLIGPNTEQLYWYDQDKSGQSTCYGTCAASWPPLPAKPGDKPSGKFSIVARRDGSKQWAYDGHPLYTWKNDVKAGSRAGYPITPHWHVAHVANL